MKIVLALDSFKGTLTAREVCDAVAEGIRPVRPDIKMVSVPMADGGEGTAEAMMSALGGEWISMTVTGPLSHMKVKAGYAWLEHEKTAVVEMAVASGLPLLKPEERNPMIATTYGTGELIRAAIEKGAKKILLTVGGSATVDGGVGAAEALGWKFFPNIGKIVPPENLNMPEVDVLCDVTNPLCGPNGAAHVYGPQKGATPDMVKLLDSRLWKLSEEIFQCLKKNVRDVPGAGAAGGLAAGAMAFMNGKLVPGIDTVMTVSGLADALKGAAWVLTGEGKFDSQSVQGKVVDGVARLAKQAGAKTAVFAGTVRLTKPEWRAAGIDAVYALNPPGMSLDEAIARSREHLVKAGAAFARDL
jgi:glycerate kinase